jgi:hypothetical protein
MSYSNEVIEALGTLRTAARGGYRLQPEVRAAINTLDNAGVFRALDEQSDYSTTDTEQDQHGNSTTPDGGWEEYQRSMEEAAQDVEAQWAEVEAESRLREAEEK